MTEVSTGMRLIFAIFVAVALASSTPCAAGTPPRACEVPNDLGEILMRQYPGSRVASTADLTAAHRSTFRKKHPNRCSGAAELDFYGDGRPTWALVLLSGSGAAARARLVVARRRAGDWDLRSLEETDAAIVPVVWSEGPGKYTDVYGEKSVIARHSVVVFAGYESWGVVYAWTGTDVAKVWIAD